MKKPKMFNPSNYIGKILTDVYGNYYALKDDGNGNIKLIPLMNEYDYGVAS